jgi:hypothetical protein
MWIVGEGNEWVQIPAKLKCFLMFLILSNSYEVQIIKRGLKSWFRDKGILGELERKWTNFPFNFIQSPVFTDHQIMIFWGYIFFRETQFGESDVLTLLEHRQQ